MIQTLALTVLGAGTCLSGTAAAGQPKGIPERRLIRVGDTRIYSNGLEITFKGVKDDSRCPDDVVCVTAGDATIILRIKAGKQRAKEYQLHTNRVPRVLVIPAAAKVSAKAGEPKSYRVKFVSLNPRPFAVGKKVPQDEFQLDLQVFVTF